MRDRGSRQSGNRPAASAKPAANKGKRKAEVESDGDTPQANTDEPLMALRFELKGNYQPPPRDKLAVPEWLEDVSTIGDCEERKNVVDLTTTDELGTATNKLGSGRKIKTLKRMADDADGESFPAPRQPVGRLPGSQSVPNLGNPDTLSQGAESPSIKAHMNNPVPEHLAAGPRRVIRTPIPTPSWWNTKRPRESGMSNSNGTPSVSTGYATSGMSNTNGTSSMSNTNGTPSVSTGDGAATTGHSNIMGHNITLPPPVMTGDLVPTGEDPATASIRSQRSWVLNYLTSPPRGRPTVAQAFNEQIYPFVETLSKAPKKCDFSVVKIKNIPFKTTEAEIMAFLGRKAKLIPDYLDPVHIMMERVTSKTLDAYVEFKTLEGAVAAIARHGEAQRNGRPNRIGDRPVEIVVSSQESLMAELFPHARGIEWVNITPKLKERNPNEPWETFKGFVSEEEMTMLVKHVKVPHRSPFSRECPQRPYECMISTLRKLPWHMTDWITFRQRYSIFEACYLLIKHLLRILDSGCATNLLNERLFNHLTHTAMRCPGFTIAQKDDLATLIGIQDSRRYSYGLPLNPGSWVHLYGVGPRMDMPLDVIEYYIAIIREETIKKVNSLSYDERAHLANLAQNVDKTFGYLWWELALPTGQAFDDLTLGQAARHELYIIERILTRAFS
ncbi:hypothetical protein MAPG_10377 [Magnaporthiopsis poae ATCC 64411]|uniref:RRM domain-containing protein n=1 Tax=Magnaporthiopsis poae (strain ATCC 64411 / 73-15) TaxID=644358 RepID=A0A0C4ECF3_MAGP6|nr:hypothetical protein MAPG_10377 [Magnaporthiopsis poae ATCC 64411]